ncbi:unnamed protein product [Owenia fusiformis]|uniref:F-box/LRR-repeat protein 15-like leucin rich repeat domain-containing protein n=1 Tax=Owenia fusiformis TaxID=6347 RepID=A0A8J1UCY7_OWEFU|nr:unnamed protein product [Owenia fusiformis]
MASVSGNNWYRVPTLMKSCLEGVVQGVSHNMSGISTLPNSVKDRLMILMSKRGLLNDDNLGLILTKSVVTLDLSECDVSDIGLEKIAVCTQLRKLDLNSAKESRTTITSNGVSVIAAACHNLQVVYLRRCLTMTDPGVVALATNCPRLRELNIGGCTQITDVSLHALANCKYLECINIANTDITDNGVIALAMGSCAKALKEVHMDHCKNITDESIEGLLQMCPRINILLFHACPKVTEQSRVALEEMLQQSGESKKVKQITWTVY